MDPDWKRRVESFFGVTLHNGYGMTEASPGIATTRVGMERNDTSCGPILPEQEVRIVPAPGASGLMDGVGEILIRGPNIMKGYYKNPDETAKAIDAEGFLHTGRSWIPVRRQRVERRGPVQGIDYSIWFQRLSAGSGSGAEQAPVNNPGGRDRQICSRRE